MSEIYHEKIIEENSKITFSNFTLHIPDVYYLDRMVKSFHTIFLKISNFPFKDFELKKFFDVSFVKSSKNLSVETKNTSFSIQSQIDYNQQINKLIMKIKEFSMKYAENNGKTIETIILGTSFGLDQNKGYDYPLLVMPLVELNADLKSNVIKMNITGAIDNGDLKREDKLDAFIYDTNSTLIYLNFQYLNTFYFFIQRMHERSVFIRSLILKEINSIQTVEQTSKNVSFLFSCQQLKIVYLLKYLNKYRNIFDNFHEVKNKGYFGYIFRFNSINVRYIESKRVIKGINVAFNDITMCFLSEKNFNNAIYFNEKFCSSSMSIIENFNSFFNLPNDNRFPFLCHNSLKYFTNRKVSVEQDIEFTIDGALMQIESITMVSVVK